MNGKSAEETLDNRETHRETERERGSIGKQLLLSRSGGKQLGKLFHLACEMP